MRRCGYWGRCGRGRSSVMALKPTSAVRCCSAATTPRSRTPSLASSPNRCSTMCSRGPVGSQRRHSTHQIPRLTELSVADPPELWEALGFGVSNGRLDLGGVGVALGAEGRGIVGWAISGVDGDIDGLPTLEAKPPL